jgi:hypothetical protein
MFCVQEFSSMMVEVERDHAERRINTLQQHYKRRRQAEHDEEVYLLVGRLSMAQVGPLRECRGLDVVHTGVSSPAPFTV